jgi:hypothetical protein
VTRDGSGIQASIGSLSLRRGSLLSFPALMASARAMKAAILRLLDREDEEGHEDALGGDASHPASPSANWPSSPVGRHDLQKPSDRPGRLGRMSITDTENLGDAVADRRTVRLLRHPPAERICDLFGIPARPSGRPR